MGAWGNLGRVRPLILAALIFALLSALAGTAQAAETVIGFDGLTPGTEVSGQYTAQGLLLGKAASIGLGTQEADCGAPLAREDAALEPPSPPGYAELQKCTPSGPTFEGTYGRLSGESTGPVTVYVRNTAVGGAPSTAVELIAFDGTGKAVATEHAIASNSAWTKITLAGAARIGFIGIRTTEKVLAVNLAIDSLAFQTPPEEPPGTTTAPTTPPTTTAKPPLPPPPTSAATVITPVPHSGEPVTITGAGSSPGSGRVISYEWDLNGDGKIDTSTGTNPIVRMPFPRGVHVVGLTVTNSSGEKASSLVSITVTGITLPPKPDGGEGECATRFEVLHAQLLAECVQKVPNSKDLVVQSRQLDLNGMILVPKEGGYGLWHITEKRRLGAGTEYILSGSPVRLELANTPVGDITLGDYDLEASPVTLAFVTEVRPVLKIGLTLRVRAHAADEQKEITEKGSLLFSVAVGKQCAAGEKKIGCCPPSSQTKACAELPGGFPLTGSVVVYLTNKGQVLLDVQVALDLKDVNFQATGELEIIASLETGIELSTLKFTIPEASLAPIFKVKEASFAYYFPGNPDPNKRDTWIAKANISFGLMEEPGIEGELQFQHGQFHSASMAVTLPPPGIPIYAGIFLNKIGASVGVEPTSFGGLLGAKIAKLLELELQFKYAEANGEQLGFFGGKGTLKYEDNEIATLEGDVYSDGYSDALLQIKIGVPFGSKEPIVSVEGEIGYWDEAASGLWEASGRVHAKIWVLEGEIAGLVNNRYIAGCAYLGPFGAVGYWDLQQNHLGGEGLFGGGCKDHLKPYKQTPLKQHTGGFVNETETESLRAPLPQGPHGAHGLPGAEAWAAGVPTATIALAADPLGRDLRISSSTGTPVVTLSGPGGRSFTTPAVPGKVVSSGNQFIAALGGDLHHVIVYLSSPSGGEWHVHRAPGSAPITAVEVAEVAPPPAVHTVVHNRAGGHDALSYSVSNIAGGMKVRFYERGKDSIHGLATVTAAKGTILFKPIEAVSRARRIYATVLSAAGVPLQTIAAGSYLAPAAAPAKPPRLRLVRRGSTALLSWGAASGARMYRVRIRGSDGRLDTLFARAGHRSETLRKVLPTESFTATVTAVGANLLPGRPASVTLHPVRAKRRHR